jgi:hypothetical protein
MTQIEALLRVDGGDVPPGAQAFFAEDDQDGSPLLRAAMAGATALAAASAAGLGAGRFVVALMLLAAAGLAVLAWPTIRDDEEQLPPKRQVLVVTPQGLIVRDDMGLRSWQFEDLAGVVEQFHTHRPYLVLIEQDGTRHALDHLRFRRGGSVHQIIDERVRRRA